jgi:hypothetical protein
VCYTPRPSGLEEEEEDAAEVITASFPQFSSLNNSHKKFFYVNNL